MTEITEAVERLRAKAYNMPHHIDAEGNEATIVRYDDLRVASFELSRLSSELTRLQEEVKGLPRHDGKDWVVDEARVEAASEATGVKSAVIRACVRAYWDQAHDSDKAALATLQGQQS